MTGYKKGMVKITTGKGSFEVPALLKGGLAIHHPALPNGWQSKGFRVTHAQSGLAVTPGIAFAKQKQAKVYLEMIVHLKDWTQPPEALNTYDIGDQIKQAYHIARSSH